MYELINVFEIFLPQLLTYPNSQDPLNSTAAMLHMKDPEKYKQTVKEYVQKYAKEDFKLVHNLAKPEPAPEAVDPANDPELSPTSELDDNLSNEAPEDSHRKA